MLFFLSSFFFPVVSWTSMYKLNLFNSPAILLWHFLTFYLLAHVSLLLIIKSFWKLLVFCLWDLCSDLSVSRLKNLNTHFRDTPLKFFKCYQGNSTLHTTHFIMPRFKGTVDQKVVDINENQWQWSHTWPYLCSDLIIKNYSWCFLKAFFLDSHDSANCPWDSRNPKNMNKMWY